MIRKLFCILILAVISGHSVANSYCNSSAWNSTYVYVGGDTVQYQSHFYQSMWWNLDRNPSEYSGNWQEWTYIGAISDCDATSSSSSSSSGNPCYPDVCGSSTSSSSSSSGGATSSSSSSSSGNPCYPDVCGSSTSSSSSSSGGATSSSSSSSSGNPCYPDVCGSSTSSSSSSSGGATSSSSSSSSGNPCYPDVCGSSTSSSSSSSSSSGNPCYPDICTKPQPLCFFDTRADKRYCIDDPEMSANLKDTLPGDMLGKIDGISRFSLYDYLPLALFEKTNLQGDYIVITEGAARDLYSIGFADRAESYQIITSGPTMPQPVTGMIDLGPQRIMMGDNFDLTAINISDPLGEIESYLWDFGDGSISTEVSPAHRYRVPGFYEIGVTVKWANEVREKRSILAVSIPIHSLCNNPIYTPGNTYKAGSFVQSGGINFECIGTTAECSSQYDSEFGPNAFLAPKYWKHSGTCSIEPPNCNYPTYNPEASYATGDIVIVRGGRYRCLVSGWCSADGPFAPGIGWAWEHAWEFIGHSCTE